MIILHYEISTYKVPHYSCGKHSPIKEKTR